MNYQTLDAVGDALVRATGIETEAMFTQGQIILNAANEGFKVNDITRHCAGLVRRKARTLYRRYAVARTFKEPHPELTWEFHGLAADTVDYHQTDEKAILAQQKQAQAWLGLAASENYSTRTLKAAIRASGGHVEDKPQIIFDGAMATVIEEHLADVIRLHIHEAIDLSELPLKVGTQVQLTIVLQAVAVEKEPQS